MEGQTDTDTFASQVVLRKEKGGEAQALHLLEKARLFFAVKPEVLSDFRLAVLEACLNALEHGQPPVEVEVEAHRRDDGVHFWVRVIDHGPGFHPEAVPQPQLADKLSSPRKRGWGLEIMRRFADGLAFDSQPGRMVVSLYRLASGS
ncbi:MAG: ATP-binding protein [Thermoanaerobaculum sp.]